MIYTITFNPALDYIVKMDDFNLGHVNRSSCESVYAGGKGINVSIVLNNLGVKSKALGFIAGFTGQEIEREVREFGCDTDFIKLKNGMSRINVKIKADVESEINGGGPDIPEEALEELYEKLNCLTEGDILVLAGSIPKTMPVDIYEKIMESLQDKGVKFIVDTTGESLLKVLKYKPFLIKPNDEEIKDIFGIEITNKEDVIKVLEFLYKRGAQNIFLTMGEKGSYFYNGENIYFATAQKVKLMSSACAGDSALAGFLSIWLENPDNIEKALKRASATGANVAESNAIGNLKKVEEYTKNIKVRRVG